MRAKCLKTSILALFCFYGVKSCTKTTVVKIVVDIGSESAILEF
jgi:hypothetical protein